VAINVNVWLQHVNELTSLIFGRSLYCDSQIIYDMNACCFHYVAIHLHDVSSFTCCNQTFTFIATHWPWWPLSYFLPKQIMAHLLLHDIVAMTQGQHKIHNCIWKKKCLKSILFSSYVWLHIVNGWLNHINVWPNLLCIITK
jgi:hypothetical protein